MARPFTKRVDMPHGIQVSCPELFAHPGAVRFMGNLVRLLGEKHAIGEHMARRLYGFRWPALRAQEDPKWRWLYIARHCDAGIVKIGISSNPIARMVALGFDAGRKGPFDLVAVVPRCSNEHEQALCDLFRDSVLRGAEWFRDTQATRILCWNAALQRNDCNEALGAHLYPELRRVSQMSSSAIDFSVVGILTGIVAFSFVALAIIVRSFWPKRIAPRVEKNPFLAAMLHAMGHNVAPPPRPRPRIRLDAPPLPDAYDVDTDELGPEPFVESKRCGHCGATAGSPGVWCWHCGRDLQPVVDAIPTPEPASATKWDAPGYTRCDCFACGAMQHVVDGQFYADTCFMCGTKWSSVDRIGDEPKRSA